MPSVADIDLEAPGLAFSSLLRLAKPKRIKTLLPDEMLEVMDGLEPGFSGSNRLTELAVNMLDPTETLQNDTLRDAVISLMPLRKARELCAKLGTPAGRNPFDDALKLASDEENLPSLLSFFGVVDDPTAPGAQLPGNDSAPVGYGLFEHQRLAARRVDFHPKLSRLGT